MRAELAPAANRVLRRVVLLLNPALKTCYTQVGERRSPAIPGLGSGDMAVWLRAPFKAIAHSGPTRLRLRKSKRTGEQLDAERNQDGSGHDLPSHWMMIWIG
jgi:hypothetical protein